MQLLRGRSVLVASFRASHHLLRVHVRAVFDNLISERCQSVAMLRQVSWVGSPDDSALQLASKQARCVWPLHSWKTRESGVAVSGMSSWSQTWGAVWWTHSSEATAPAILFTPFQRYGHLNFSVRTRRHRYCNAMIRNSLFGIFLDPLARSFSWL